MSDVKRRFVCARAFLALTTTLAMLLVPVQPGTAQPSTEKAGPPENAGPPAKLPPGPPESARHPAEGRQPDPQDEEHAHEPAAPLGAQRGPNASVRGLSEAAELRGPGSRFFEDDRHEPHVVQLFTDPINYRDDDGEWKPIDNTVVPTEGGYTNAANSFDVFFPTTATPTDPFVLDFPEGSISFSLIGAAHAAGVATENTVTYAAVHPHVDVAFDVVGDGVKERAILTSRQAPGVLRYALETEGLTLSEGPGGSIAIGHDGNTFGHIPPAFAYDSSAEEGTDEPATTYDVAMDLGTHGPGAYTLELRVDPRWLNDPDRVFPVTVDPSVVHTRCANYPQPCPDGYGAPLIKDTFIRDGLNTRQDSASYLHVGRTGGGDNRTFMTFDVRQEIRKVGDLIYDAKFDINVDSSWSTETTPLELRRITQDWDAATTWEYARPDVHLKVWAQNNGCSDFGCKDGWTQWDVSDLMQYWIDTKVLSNHGWELSVNSSSSPNGWKTYVSGDHANADRRPYVNVWVNAMPGTKDFVMDDSDWPKLELAWEAIPSGTVIEIDTPKLEIRDLTDENDDRILVRYQVSKNPAGSFGSGIEYDSGWIDERHSLRVPSGYLSEGTHYWRVMAGDACPEKYKDPDEPPLGNGQYICDDLGADNTRAVTTNERPISEVRSFTISDHGKGLGKDPRWAMWRKPLGNGMQLSVNQSNGNAVLEYPIDLLGTAEAPIKVGLTHNTHQAMRVQKEQAVAGLPPGWEIAAGPAADPQQMPARIKPLTYRTPVGTVTYGVAVVYETGKRDVLIDTGDGMFTMAGPSAPTVRSNGTAGWTMTTYSGGTYTFSTAGTLIKARPSSSRPGMPGFDYTFVDGRIRHLVDPMGRKLTFNYEIPAGGTKTLLKEVVAFDDQTDPSSKLVWTIGYENERIVSIKDPENATVKLAYDTSERLSKIYDAVQAAATTPLPTTIEYNTSVFGTDRAAVTKVALPSVEVVPPEDQRSSSDPYATSPSTPTWEFKYTKATSNADYSKETRTTGPRGVLTTDAEDHMVVTDFNDIGLPIMQRGPRIKGEFGGWPVTEKVWDFETGNLVCHRGPAANKVASVACGSSDGLQTQYEYQKRAPYLLTKVTGSADEANGARLVTTYGYDEGFSGLQAHYYNNNTLTGMPDAVGTVPTVSESWGEGGPSQIGADTDFSVRFFGEWKPPNATQARDYQFRVTGEDEARLIVGKEILVDCISTGALRKCGGVTQNTATAKGVGPAAVPIVVELRAATGPAHVKLEWKRPDGAFEVVPESDLRPATNARTSEKVGSVAAPSAYSTRTYEYATGDSKIRRLPTRVELTGGAEIPRTVAQSASYTYDDHGRITTETDATGKDVVHSYDVHGPCEHTTTDRVGLVTTRVCNLAGDVVSETTHVGGVTVNGSTDVERRTTTTTYTSLGRVDRVDFADGGYVDHDYDLAGRLVKKTVLQSAGGMTRVTEYVRNAQGWVTEERLPDPDGTGPTERPIVEARYDSEGNRVVREDERDNKWTAEFDALGRRIERRDPLDNVWVWKYGFAGVLRKKVDPHGVVQSFEYDALNRLKSNAVGSLAPETTTYDLRGSVATTTDPDGIQTSFEYDAAGSVVEETTPTGTKVTKYDGSGFLVEEVSRRNLATTYGYDDMGHLKTVTAPGGYTTQYVLNEAGEVEVTRLPRETEAPGSWQFDYDKVGRVTREVDAAGGVDTFTYNKAGEVVATTDGSGYRIENVYDRLGRVTEKIAYEIGESGAPDTEVDDVGFTYDATGNMKEATNDEGAIVVVYDDAGRILTVASEDTTTAFDYEGLRLESRTDAAGTTSYTYDSGTGRIQSISGPFDATHTTKYDYKPSGRVWRQTEMRGTNPAEHLVTTYSYDNAGRLSEKTATNPEGTTTYAQFTSTYNADSQVTSRTRTITDGTLSHPDNGTWRYTYDARGLLDTATDPDDVLTEYDFDGAGNRTLVKETRTDGGVTRVTSSETTYVGMRPQATTKTITIDGVAGVPLETTYEHDGAGNLERIDGPGEWRSFTYDEWGQMQTANKGIPAEAAILEHIYSYDALGRTIEKGTGTKEGDIEIALTRELFWHAGLSDELVQSSLRGPSGVDADTVVTSYGYRNGEPYATAREVPLQEPAGSIPVSISWLGTDPHGDVVYSMNGNRELNAMQSYDPWGVLREDIGEKPHLGFQSDHTDRDVGVVDMGARYYLPELGRFITQDTYTGQTASPLTQNRYVYGLDDPVSMVDPTGHTSQRASGGGGCWCVTSDDNTSHPEVSSTPSQPPPGPAPEMSAAQGPPGNSFVTPLVWIVRGGLELTGLADADTCATEDDMSASSRSGTCAMALPWGRVVKAARAVWRFTDDVAETTTAILKFDPEFAAAQLLGRPAVTPGGLKISFHAAERIVGVGNRIPTTLEHIDEIYANVTKVVYQTPDVASYAPTFKLIAEKLPGSPYIVLDATQTTVVTVLIRKRP